MATTKVYVSGWLEYRVDNPAALIDASKFTPQELDPNQASNLGSVDQRVWAELGNALLVEVAKGTKFTVPPGTTSIDNKITFSLSPPNQS